MNRGNKLLFELENKCVKNNIKPLTNNDDPPNSTFTREITNVSTSSTRQIQIHEQWAAMGRKRTIQMSFAIVNHVFFLRLQWSNFWLWITNQGCFIFAGLFRPLASHALNLNACFILTHKPAVCFDDPEQSVTTNTHANFHAHSLEFI